MVQPVVRALSAAGRRCRVLSLCEFRGFRTPKDAFAFERVEVTPLVPLRLRGKPGGASVAGGSSGAARQLIRRGLRKLAWTALHRRIDRCVGSDTAVAVLPNDSAYPYRGIADLLRQRGVPFVLLQEGVRFNVPGMAGDDSYGQGGAEAVAAWGESSAAYFRSQGVPEHAIHLTGNPRFDGFDRTEWTRKGQTLRADLDIRDRRLVVYLSNPIELLGLTRTTDEKVALFRRFCQAARTAFERDRIRVVVKLHASEPARDYRRALDGWAPEAIRIVEGVPLYALLAAADAAVILSSTVGMEALLFDLPLGVVELPKVGYAFDYVQRGAAIGLGSSEDEMHDNIARLLVGSEPTPQARERYLRRMMAVRSGATDRVAELVERCARS